MTILRIVVASFILIFLAFPVRSDEKPAQAREILALIDKLTTVAHPDVGYSGSVNGESFVPLDAEGNVHGMLMFQEPSVRSDVLTAIVKAGAPAVPHLLAHLDDNRVSRVWIQGGIGGIMLGDEPDRNRRTNKPIQIDEKKLGKPTSDDKEGGHQLTVGDLCYVALGQILNRRYVAVKYVPSLMVHGELPTRTPALFTIPTLPSGLIAPILYNGCITFSAARNPK